MPGPPTPGLTMPLIVTGPVVPVPPSVPPLLTVTLLLGWLPLTKIVPAFTVVEPVYVLAPDRVSTPVPVLVRAPNCWIGLAMVIAPATLAVSVSPHKHTGLVDTVRVEPASTLTPPLKNMVIPPVSVLLPLTLSTATALPLRSMLVGTLIPPCTWRVPPGLTRTRFAP